MLLSILFTRPEIFIIWIIAIVFGITVHEFAHAFAAYKMGDNTAKYLGRLTLNPLKHMDVMGSLMLLLVGFGWGKPVPFNPYNLRYKKFGAAIVAIAGPLANLISVFVFGIMLYLIDSYTSFGDRNLLLSLFFVIVILNIFLILFNLLPIPPLDGSKVLYAFLPSSKQNVVIFLEKYGIYILLAFIILGGSILSFVFGYFISLSSDILHYYPWFLYI